MAHFKSTGVCLLILSLNTLNTKIYLRIVIYEDLFEFIRVDLLELIDEDLFPKIYQNLFRTPERTTQQKMLSRQRMVADPFLSAWLENTKTVPVARLISCFTARSVFP
jgi:hypothetical protein